MIRVQLGSPGMELVLCLFLILVSLHVGLWRALRVTPPEDRWRVFDAFARVHRLGVGGIVFVIKVFRKLGAREPVHWARRDGASSR
jgi:hypothetical protein